MTETTLILGLGNSLLTDEGVGNFTLKHAFLLRCIKIRRQETA